ncbi:response regulator [Acinetobacter rongchengensis]|uniref:DNA-binding response regulator n=1 Tax=Acinetobacter rongchengensis TaxID=2419601 RepID=A0A3A8FF88_9GAMM|nr:response regulator transcription factor [Acinetobacter rongchengensis]RKG39801.1 DNA-binding response regulator [Acinetobacter rongchengensis]
MPIINILLIDDHTLFRTGLRFLLEQEENFNVIGEATDGLSGIKLAEQLHPDIVLLDLDMPIMNGLEALPQLLNSYPDLVILILTVSEDAVDLTECMRLGARGYLLKNIETRFLIDGIYKAIDGDNVLSPEMTTKLISQLCNPIIVKEETALAFLTQREKETLHWLAKGASNKIIARSMNVAESTVKVHVQNVLRKLELNSRVQAAVFAVEHGLDKNL